MVKKGKKTTKAGREAGRKNLIKYRKKNPTPALKHGGYSSQVRQRYTDKRTTEGRGLALIMRNLKADLGDISIGQGILLDRIREKLIVLAQIGKYADRQISLINKRGELLPCLGRNYTSFSEALRRDIEALYGMANKDRRSRVPTIKELVRGKA